MPVVFGRIAHWAVWRCPLATSVHDLAGCVDTCVHFGKVGLRGWGESLNSAMLSDPVDKIGVVLKEKPSSAPVLDGSLSIAVSLECARNFACDDDVGDVKPPCLTCKESVFRLVAVFSF